MKQLYLETSVVSYLTSRPSTDILAAAHQHVTARWWAHRRVAFELWASELVLEEAARGAPDAAQRRLAVLKDLPLLKVTAEAKILAVEIVKGHLLPERAFPDALHISVAAIHGVDYLLTWNCAHIANAEILPRVELLVHRAGFPMPIVCTPEELLGDATYVS